MRSRGTYGVSPTYDICRMLAKKAGKLPPGEDFDRDLDEVDAGFVRRRGAIRSIACSTSTASYCGLTMSRAYWKATCRAQSIRLREYDDTLVRAVGNFEDFVARYALVVHNQRQDNLTIV